MWSEFASFFFIETNAASTCLANHNQMEALIHIDSSHLSFNGKFFKHTFTDGSEQWYSTSSFPLTIRYGKDYNFNIIANSCIKFFEQSNSRYKSTKRAPKVYEDVKKTELIGIREKSIVEGIGKFTAFHDGRVSAVFEDNTIVYVDKHKKCASVILFDGELIEVNLDHPFGVEKYIDVAVEFMEWAFFTVEDRVKKFKEEQENHAKIQNILSRTSQFLYTEALHRV
jgi:hypothetical protein